jgi:unconventional prefoldin RPB5 interactor 1
MAPVRDPLVDLELRRLQLEEQISKLRKALRHWQTWDAEYEGLKEELTRLKDNSTREDILRSGKEFGGTLVNEEEVKSLLGNLNVMRTKSQVIGLLSRRIDYVHQNVQTVEKQLGTAEEKLKSLLVVQRPEMTDEDGLPLTEIVEELDEEGEVISGTTTTPGDAAPELLETLRKGGLKDTPEPSSKSKNSGVASNRIKAVESSDEEEDKETKTRYVENIKAGKRPESSHAPETGTKLPSVSSVSTDRGHSPSASSTNGISPLNIAVPSNKRNDSDSSDEEPSNDEDDFDPGVGGVQDTPEEARQRREMLQYSMNGLHEVGAVVAELEIDEEGVDDEAIDLPLDEEYDEEMLESDPSEDEDQYGRSTVSMISDDYRQQMMELEERLNGTGLRNLGPDPKNVPKEVIAKAESPLAPVAGKTNPGIKEKPKGGKKKKVAFAEDLDIAPSLQKPTAWKEAARKDENLPPTMQESIVERQPKQTTLVAEPLSEAPKKTSRFKSARNATGSAKPDATEAPVETHSSTVVERTPSHSRPKSPDLDDFDENLHRQEIAKEYYNKRNNLIKRQGGFMAADPEEQAQVPLPEEEGGPKKMSRFKAARLK